MNIRIENPCNENWDEMTPDEKGRFCNQCATSVIDFTKLSNQEVIGVLNANKEGLCGRVTSSQLKTPFIHFPEPNQNKIPYSKIAANVMLVASAFGSQSCTTKTTGQITIEQHTSSGEEVKLGEVSVNVEVDHSQDTIDFTGKIVRELDSTVVGMAKVEFITISHIYSAYTDSNGFFTLEIPQIAIKDKNVIRTSYDKSIRKPIDQKGETLIAPFDFLKSQDYFVSKEQLTKIFPIIAEPDQIFLGFGHYSEVDVEPKVFHNGIEIEYKEFEKSRSGEKSTCNLANTKGYYFTGDYASNLLGYKTEGELYLYFD